MAFKHNKDVGRESTSLLACMFVLVGGILVCGFIVFVFAESPAKLLAVMFGTAAATGILAWLLRSKPKGVAGQRLGWLLFTKPPKFEVNYEPKLRRPRRSEEKTENRPPTVDELRELKQNVNTWVPTRLPKD